MKLLVDESAKRKLIFDSSTVLILSVHTKCIHSYQIINIFTINKQEQRLYTSSATTIIFKTLIPPEREETVVPL